METKNLAKKLRELRTLRGMSQEYLAEESRVSLRTIQRIENNESVPTGETIKRIASALDVELSELSKEGTVSETSDIKATLVFLKKQLNKTSEKSEIRTFEKFISILTKLREKELSPDQLDRIESYLAYLELEKIPSFNNDIFKNKLSLFKKYLKNKLRFVPTNYYTMLTAGFGVAFATAFAVQTNIDTTLKIGVASAAIIIIAIGVAIDSRIKRQNRSFNF